MFDWSEFFAIDNLISTELFKRVEDPAEVLNELGDYIKEVGPKLGSEYSELGHEIWVHNSAKIDPVAHLTGPVIIGPDVEILYTVYLRGNVILERGAKLANSTEVKNAILLPNACCPHFNYVGDSIMGYKAHLGAGVILSNLRSDRQNIEIKMPNGNWQTGRHKFGAVLGDCVEVGCQSVLNPGTLVGKDSKIYPLSSICGYFPANSKVGNRPIFGGLDRS